MLVRHFVARIAITLGWLAGGLFLLALSGEAESINLPYTSWRVDGERIGTVAVAIMVMAPTCLFLPARYSLAGCLFLYGVLVAVVLGFHEPRRGDIVIWQAGNDSRSLAGGGGGDASRRWASIGFRHRMV